jgi:hypothetical protein
MTAEKHNCYVIGSKEWTCWRRRREMKNKGWMVMCGNSTNKPFIDLKQRANRHYKQKVTALDRNGGQPSKQLAN